MKHKIKILNVIIITVIVTSMLTGCFDIRQSRKNQPVEVNNGTSSVATPENDSLPQKNKDDFSIDWYVNISWWKWPGEYGNDYLSELLRKKTGAIINFITPASDGSQQLATMIASGTLTDVVTVESWLDYETKMAQGGYLWSINDLNDKYAPDFNELISKDIYDWYSEPDGKIYGLPNFAYSKDNLKPGEKQVPNTGFTLRKDIYDQLGKPETKNPEAFLNLLEKVKNNVKSYNDRPIVPLQLYEFTDQGNQSVTWLAQYFSVPFEDSQGKYLDIRTHQKFFEVIKFLNAAYNRGLILPENFSETREMINEKIARGEVFSMFTAPQDFKYELKALFQNDSNAAYQVFMLQNYEGDRPYLADISGFGWLISCISKNAKEPDKIIKLFHYLYSQDGQMDMKFGGKELYTINEKGYVEYNSDIQQALITPEGRRKYAFDFDLMTDWLKVRDFIKPPEKAEDIASNDIMIKGALIEYTYDGKLGSLKTDPNDKRSNTMLDLSKRIDLYWGKQLIKMIMAQSETEVRKVYDSTIVEMKKMGLDELLSYNNDRFQLAKKALGVKFAWPGNKGVD